MPFVDAGVKDYCSILSGFENKAGYPKITHHEGMACFSGHPMAERSGLFSKSGGPTIDQVIAAAIGKNTTFASLQVGISRKVSKNEGPTLQFLSHKGTNEPLPPEYSPAALHERLFAKFTPQQAKSVALRAGVLDAVHEDVKRLKSRVGKADQTRLDAHLTGVEALEKQIKALPPVCTIPAPTTETNTAGPDGIEPITNTARAMADLLVYAFACDLTRVASYMFTSGVGFTVFREIGMTMEHHGLTHTSDHEKVHRTVVHTMQHLAYLLERMKATPDGTKNLLDNAIVLAGSDCAEGYTHSVFDQPILVAGKGGGALKHPSLHYRSKTKENTADILLSLLRVFDPKAASVGSQLGISTTPCKPILA
jgi:hypothetical protein